MTEERRPRLEGMLDRTARRLSGSGLHPLEVLQAVRDVAEASVRDGMVANELTVGLHPEDFVAMRPSFPAIREEVERVLDELERVRGLGRVGERTVRLEESLSATPGSPVVSARFVGAGKHAKRDTAGPTRELTRLRGWQLVLDDGSRVPLTHVPFVIGRGPGNDLVLPSFAVSRRHAQIVATAAGLVIRDLGSRNGLVANGARVSEVPLQPGVRVVVGDVTLWLEAV